MTTNAKIAAVATLKEKFDGATATLLTEYRGLTVAEVTELRHVLGADAEYSVAKNTLILRAANEAGVEGLDDLLTGPTAVAFVTGEAVDVAKTLKKFAGEHDKLVVKGGYLDGAVLDAEQVKALADMDNRETTLAKLAGAFKASSSKAAGLFAAPASQVARLAAALQEKKEAA